LAAASSPRAKTARQQAWARRYPLSIERAKGPDCPIDRCRNGRQGAAGKVACPGGELREKGPVGQLCAPDSGHRWPATSSSWTFSDLISVSRRGGPRLLGRYAWRELERRGWARLSDSWPIGRHRHGAIGFLVFGYLWFFLYAAWVYDAPDARNRWTRLGVLAAIDLAMGLGVRGRIRLALASGRRSSPDEPLGRHSTPPVGRKLVLCASTRRQRAHGRASPVRAQWRCRSSSEAAGCGAVRAGPAESPGSGGLAHLQSEAGAGAPDTSCRAGMTSVGSVQEDMLL
jgi:hypothetical protein